MSSGPSVLLEYVTEIPAWDQPLHWGRKEEKNRRASVAEGFRAEKRNEYMRELFDPDPLARHEKMEGFQIFFCLIIKRFYS